MYDQSIDRDLEVIRRDIEYRLEDDIRWHLKHTPQVSQDSLIEIAYRHENERFEYLRDCNKRKGKETLAKIYEYVRKEELPRVVQDRRSKH